MSLSELLMRVTSDLWVSALCAVFSAPADLPPWSSVARPRPALSSCWRGAGWATSPCSGRRRRQATIRPSPTTVSSAFSAPAMMPAVLDARLEREKKFDPDIWVVEIEAGDRSGRGAYFREDALRRGATSSLFECLAAVAVRRRGVANRPGQRSRLSSRRTLSSATSRCSRR